MNLRFYQMVHLIIRFQVLLHIHKKLVTLLILV